MPFAARVFAAFSLILLMSNASLDKATYELGKKLFNDERYEEAAVEFKKVVSRNQGSSYYQISLYYTGLSYQFARQPQRALGYFKELYKTSASPKQKELALYGVGKSYFDQGRYANAIKMLKQYLQSFPGAPQTDAALYMLGKSYDSKGYTGQARIWYDQLIRQFPASPYTQYAQPAQPQPVKTVTPQQMSETQNVPRNTTQVNQTVVQPQQQEWADLTEIQEDILPLKQIQPTQKQVTQPQYQPQYQPQVIRPLVITQYIQQPQMTQKEPQPPVAQKKLPQKIKITMPEDEPAVIPVKGRVEGLVLTVKDTKNQKYIIPLDSETGTMEGSMDTRPQQYWQPQYVNPYYQPQYLPQQYQPQVVQPQTQIQQKTVVQTNIQNLIMTNYQSFTNTTLLTQKVKVLDTEQIKIDNKRSQMEIRQEEIDRLRRLLEIKARLLELKEEAIKQKTILMRQTNAVVVTDEE